MRMQKAGRPAGATTEARREKLAKVLNPIPLENSDGAPFMDNGLREALAEAGAGFAGNQDDALPEELTEFLVNNGLGGKPFSIILKQAAVGGDAGGSGAAAYVKAFNRTIPSIEFIARNYGPGDYMFIISWRGNDNEGNSKTLSEIIDFSVSDKYEAEYLEHMQERKIEAGRKRMERLRQLKVDRVMDGAMLGEEEGPVDPKKGAIDYLKEHMEVNQMMGLTKQESPGNGLLQTLLPLAIPLLTAWMESQKNQSMQMQTQMQAMVGMLLAQAEKSNQQLLETMKIANGDGAGNRAVREFKEMIMGAVDLRDILKGKSEDTISDRVFTMIEAMLPQILTMVGMSQAQRMMDPRFHMAKAFVGSDPTFKAAMTDPAILAELIGRLDEHYGWEQTDGILNIAGLTRPETIPRDPDKKLPASERTPMADASASETQEGTDDTGETGGGAENNGV